MRYRFLRFPEGKFKAVTFSYDDGLHADIRLAKRRRDQPSIFRPQSISSLLLTASGKGNALSGADAVCGVANPSAPTKSRRLF